MGSETAEPRTDRKVYTISKAREKWTDEEHESFVQALQKRGRNWKAIVQDIGTRTVAQVRSHAQKYFLRLEKDGLKADIPPPRPKKRAAHPYPVQARDPSAPEGPQEDQPRRSSKRQRSTAPALRGRDTILAASGCHSAASGGATASGGASSVADAEAEANFSKLYAIVGSMFESSVSFPQQLSTIEHLPVEQREPLLLMLGNLSANLRQTVAHQQPGTLPAIPGLPQALPPPGSQWEAANKTSRRSKRPQQHS